MSRAEVFVAETLRMAAPYVACGLGAVITERAGLVNVAFEGTLIVSALAGACLGLVSGSAVVGLAGAIAAGAAFCFLHGALVGRGRVDAIVSGIALNIIAYGLSRFVLRVAYDSASNSPKVPPLGAELASPLLRVALHPAFLLVVLAAFGVAWTLSRTRFGLRLRATGENPEAARAAGIPTATIRLAAASLSGAVAGLGGAHLVFDQRHFDVGMSGGRGFIALAAVILGRWRPGATVLACLGFSALEAAQIAVQDVARVPSEVVQMIPYVVTLGLLAGIGRAARPPAGLGRD